MNPNHGALTSSSPYGNLSAIFKNITVDRLATTVAEYPGRVLFATQFSPEDQVLAHMIFRNKLPIRVYTYSGTSQYEMLIRSVDFFKGNIEMASHQTQLTTIETSTRYASHDPGNVQDDLLSISLSRALQHQHLLISSARKEQLAKKQQDPGPFAWDKVRQNPIYYPLFGWSEKQVYAYLDRYSIPYTLPSQQFKPRKKQQMLSLAWQIIGQMISKRPS